MILDVVTFAVSFAVAAALYPIAIRFLKQAGSGQVIQAELPESHQKKVGTPTGGGILFVALALVGGLVATIAGHAGALPALAGLALGGVIGFVDDISKLRRGSIGIPARLKLPIQLVLAIPVAWIALD
ncbi:MAG: phospho-N-acetylmuramoyl-pentapeptide-transferase, partial [Chloroflexi bacterium]